MTNNSRGQHGGAALRAEVYHCGMGGRHEAQDQEPRTDAMMGVVILALALILTAVIVLALASD